MRCNLFADEVGLYEQSFRHFLKPMLPANLDATVELERPRLAASSTQDPGWPVQARRRRWASTTRFDCERPESCVG